MKLKRLDPLSFEVGLILLLTLQFLTYARDILVYNLSGFKVSLFDLYPDKQEGLFKLFSVLSFLPYSYTLVAKALILILILCYLFLSSRKASILAIIFFVNLLIIHKEILIMEGNIWLSQIMIFFAIFYHKNFIRQSLLYALWAILLMYFFSGFNKFVSPYWYAGNGLLPLVGNEIFLSDWAVTLASKYPSLLKWSSYFVVLFELLVPCLYFTRLRKYIVLTTIFFHLMVLLVFEYYLFSLSCIILDLMLFDFINYKKLYKRWIS